MAAVHGAVVPLLDMVLPLSAVALCTLFAWGFAAHDSSDHMGIDPWQLAVGSVVVATLVAWYAGAVGA